MNDASLALGCSALLGTALAGAVVIRRLGLPSTYVRDLLHIGAGIWVLTWPWWQSAGPPVAITAAVAAGTALVPWAATRWLPAARLHAAVTGGDERWGGLVFYTGAYAVLTAVGLSGDPLPAAAALLALSMGDGIGGAVGRRFGRWRYRAFNGKRKSVEGSVTVAVMAAAGALIAAEALGRALPLELAMIAGLVAAGAEAIAPRGTDNAVVPAAVWTTLTLLT